MSNIEKAASTFLSGFNCAESVFSVFAPGFGVDQESALKLACGLGAGMARMGNVCGAVTGAYLVLGLRYGRTDPQDEGSRDRVYESVKEFTERFKAKHGSVMCKDLLGCDISTPHGYEEASERSLFMEVCPSFVRDAAAILEDML